MHDYLDEHQIKSVEALEWLKKICDENGITLYLLAGTTLGAVRHQGMIPWDDDIDVGLLREDWYRLREILPDKIKETEFDYYDNRLQEKYARLQPKIVFEGEGCVDIFLLTAWTGNKKKGKIAWQRRRFVTEAYKRKVGNRKVFAATTGRWRRIKWHFSHTLRMIPYYIIAPFTSREKILKMAERIETLFINDNTGWFVNIYSIYKMEKEMIPAEWLESTSQVEFEGRCYDTVSDTHAYLTQLYGDYMTPPPENKRGPRHISRFSNE